ncbi:MAG: D-alanyl-alanine synthetase [Leptolyngbyaceae cyanobacterium]
MYSFEQFPRYLPPLQSQLRIAVVYGGDKTQPDAVLYPTHNPRPWKSYEMVAREIQETLQSLGFQQVYLMPEDRHLPQRLKTAQIHFVWLNSGGVQGYNPLSHAPSLLEMLGIPYYGHTPLNAAILDQKSTFKQALQGAGLPTAPFITWHPHQGPFDPATNAFFQSVFNGYDGPFVVKPVTGRATLHISVVDHWADLPPVVETTYRATQNTVLVEQYLSGREFCITMRGYVTCRGDRFTKSPHPLAFSLLERQFEPGEKIFTSMDKKAISANRAHLLTAADQELKANLVALGQAIYRAFDLQSLVRIDVRADVNGQINVLEANPKPDLKQPSASRTSLVALGLAAEGMTYEEFILGLLVDRLDYLLTYQPDSVHSIQNCLGI